MKSIPMKPFDIILEARRILDKRIKTLLLFFGLNMVCLSMSFTNKPHLWFWFLVVGCHLVYEWQKRDFQSAKSLKFDSVSELEKDLNMEVTNDEWDTIKKLNEKLKMFLMYAFYVFLLVSYLIVGIRVTLSLIDNHGVLK
ncbi:RipA family octameric membrane protein, partial [Helicobacter pylori]